jgi:hypothetical protein
LREGLDLSDIKPNNYGLTLKAVKEVKSERLKALHAEMQTPITPSAPCKAGDTP